MELCGSTRGCRGWGAKGIVDVVVVVVDVDGWGFARGGSGRRRNAKGIVKGCFGWIRVVVVVGFGVLCRRGGGEWVCV